MPWLFSRAIDLWVFGGSFALAFAALGIGAGLGILHDATPGWAWVPAIVLCDVAHVWSTAFRTYLDPAERRARRALFSAVPVLGFAASIALLALGELAFWRALAYLAIFHFVRQQYGWVALYRARGGERAPLGRAIDTFAIYAATLFPLVYWHTHPRRFAWFFPGDVATLPAFVMPIARALYVVALVAYAARALFAWIRGTPNPGKDLVVGTTAIAWYVGIVHFDSDYAFTVTNVFIHGIPYIALVFIHTRARARERFVASTASLTSATSAASRGPVAQVWTRSVVTFLGLLWLVAFVEELLWDRAVWHDQPWLFGDGWDIGALKVLVVPLLALPQLTHYVLDGFIWRRRDSASLDALVRASAATPAPRNRRPAALSPSRP